MEERKAKLRAQVDELLAYMKSIQNQQMQYPLGSSTVEILHKNHFVVQSDFKIAGSTNKALEVRTNNGLFYMPVIID